MHLCDLIYFSRDLDIPSYADNTTIYAVNEKIVSHKCTRSIFITGLVKANSGKSYVVMSWKEATTAMIDGLSIESSNDVCQGISIDHELKFDGHAKYICGK